MHDQCLACISQRSQRTTILIKLLAPAALKLCISEHQPDFKVAWKLRKLRISSTMEARECRKGAATGKPGDQHVHLRRSLSYAVALAASEINADDDHANY